MQIHNIMSPDAHLVFHWDVLLVANQIADIVDLERFCRLFVQIQPQQVQRQAFTAALELLPIHNIMNPDAHLVSHWDVLLVANQIVDIVVLDHIYLSFVQIQLPLRLLL